MTRILITSGPTRQHLDPVRYLTNASSGRMGKALAEAALDLGHQVVIITGPVQVKYPDAATIIEVVSTDEMLAAAQAEFATCDGAIGAAAPCDYRPVIVSTEKIAKTGEPLALHLVETEDVIATLGQQKSDRWVVGFALETDDRRLRALAKLERKHCDLMISNGPEAMHALDNDVEVLSPAGVALQRFQGSKEDVARGILAIIEELLIRPRRRRD
jgi:phosphopantothenoylcysteine decarboxylase / phosphopantothenate---cysteine ligase